MKRIVLLLYITGIFYACSSQDTKSYHIVNEIEIPYARRSGQFICNDSLFLFNAEPVSHKIINIYDCNGVKVKDISLKGLQYLEYTNSIEIINFDSVFIYIGTPCQYYYLIDSDGNIINQRAIPREIKNDSLRVSLDAAISNYYKGSIYFKRTVYPIAKEMGSGRARVRSNAYERVSPAYYKLCVNDSSELQGYGENSFENIYPNDSLYRESGKKYVCNGYLFFITDIYKILVFDLNVNKLVSVINLQSSFANETPNKDIIVTENNYETILDNRPIIKDRGIVSGISYDAQTKQYYILLSLLNNPKSKYFIVQTFDKDFNFLREIKINEKGEARDICCFDGKIIVKCFKQNEKNNKSIVYKLYSVDF